MRAKEVVPRLAPLGARCWYTHRASGLLGGHTLRDVPRSELRRVKDLVLPYDDVLNGLHTALVGRYASEAVRMHKPLPAPRRRGNRPLHRWVVVWPELGRGVVTGLTYRSEGWRHDGGARYSGFGEPEYDSPYFEEAERYPLYQVRTSLTGSTVLVPVWALVPVHGHDVLHSLGDDLPLGVRAPGAPDGAPWQAWPSHVEAWVAA